MKIIGIVFAFFFFTSCQSTNQFEWLIGSWQRTNDHEGSHTYEYWESVESGKLKGMGCTIVAGDAVFKEDMVLINRDGQWSLEVAGPNESPVIFMLTDMTDTSFVVENPAHDFPQKIVYFLDGEELKASISGEGVDEVDFSFERKPIDL